MGYYELRTKQEQVIRHFVRGNDGFVSLPTGRGSRCATAYSYEAFDALSSSIQQRLTEATHHRHSRSLYRVVCSTIELKLHAFLVTFDDVTYIEFLRVTKTCL